MIQGKTTHERAKTGQRNMRESGRMVRRGLGRARPHCISNKQQALEAQLSHILW